MNSPEYVYFFRPIGMDGPVKIGRSIRPDCRLSTAEACSPLRLEMAALIHGNKKLEYAIHSHFFDLHSHGEWFFGDDRLTAAIAKLSAGVPVAKAIDLADHRGNIRSHAKTRANPQRYNRYYEPVSHPMLLAMTTDHPQYV